jgi:hypothetical protein
MKQFCENHPDKKALSLCHSCGEYFCSDCLNEGLEFYYCKKNECVKALNKELSQIKNIEGKIIPLSKEAKIIKRVSVVFIFLSLIALIDSLLGLKNTIGFYLIPEGVGESPHLFGYLVKYGWIFLIISLFISSFSLFSSIKIYVLKNRKLFLTAVTLNIFLIILYNTYIYAYYDFVLKTSLAVIGYEGFINYWSIEKYLIGITSFLLAIVFIYLIKKFSSEKIKKEFLKSNA